MNAAPNINARKDLDVASLHATTHWERAIVRLLAFAESTNTSPATLLRQLAMEYRGRYKKRVTSFADDIDAGIPLMDAIEKNPRVISQTTAMAIRMAHESKRLPEFYQELLQADELTNEDFTQRNHYVNLISAASQFVTIFFLISFLMIFIVPVFDQLFDEFGLRLPELTKLVIASSSVFADYGAVVFLVALMIAMPFARRRIPAFARSAMQRGFDLLAWRKAHIPDQARVLSMLAIASESGNVLEGIDSLSEQYPSAKLRRKIRQSSMLIHDGQSPWHSLARSGLLSLREADSLATSQEKDTQAWLLRWSATRRQARTAFWSGLLVKSLSISAMCGLGVVVAMVSIGLFMPLVALITGLS